jgi:hypothetical protein
MWNEFFAYGLSNQAIPAGAGTAFITTNIRIDSDADFEWHKTTYQVGNALIRLRYRDESSGIYNTKTDVGLRLIAGNFAGTPFILPRPQVIQAGTNFGVDIADASGLANTLRLTLMGAKKRPGVAPWGETHNVNGRLVFDKRFRGLRQFTYNTGATTIPASGTISARIEVDNDAHFLVTKITGVRQGNCLVEFKEAARDSNWQNIALHFDTIIGNGQFPNILFANRFVPRGSVVTIQLQDISAAQNIVEIALHGIKIFE